MCFFIVFILTYLIDFNFFISPILCFPPDFTTQINKGNTNSKERADKTIIRYIRFNNNTHSICMAV